MKKIEISKATLGRIPIYIKYLNEMSENTDFVSATTIARCLGLGEVQVRKDLSALCKSGKPKVGYERESLLKSLEQVLDSDAGGAVIVGAGKLGQALLDYPEFEIYGTKILAAFDKNVEEAKTLPSGKVIYPMSCMYDFCENNNVKLGIIAVPAEAAQEVLNQLCDCGIKIVWCFAPCRLYKPADVIIQYENLALSLAHLKLHINE